MIHLRLRSQLQELRLLLLPVLGTTRLGVALLLVLPLGRADRGGARDGFGAEISAVALFGGAVDDALVEFSGWGRGGVGGGVVEFGGLVLLRGLGRYGDGVAVGLDADGLEGCAVSMGEGKGGGMGCGLYLRVGVTDILAAVLVGEVQWVGGELGGSPVLALDEEGVVVA